MKPARLVLAISLAAAFGAAQAQESGSADSRYAARIDGRFSAFAGSSTNLQSLATGLRHSETIKLTGSGETTTIVPPTKPMGYGNITRSLDLASRQLAALGITDPTPSEIAAALNGGTVHTATGDVTLEGVLQLRSEGMGWGQIAHAIGVHPGMGAAKAAPAPAVSATGITTAAGSSVSRPGASAGRGQKPAQATDRGATVSSAAGAVPQASLAQSKGQGGANANANAGGKGLGRF
jgi:hypothetical protein